jgi:PAS domain S-box-containing protein
VTSETFRIERPEEFAPVGDALAVLGIGVTLIDRDMRVQWANRLIREYASELSCGGSHCFATLWKENQRCPDCMPLLVFRTGEPHEGVRERGRPGDPVEAWRVRAVPVRDGSGEVRWVAETFVQLSPLTLDLAGRSSAFSSDAAAGSGTALVVIDNQERIVSWSPSACAIFGYPLDEALGRRIDLVVPPDLLPEERARATRVAAEGRAPRTETIRRARDGRRVPVAISAVAVHDESGQLVGRSCVIEDLSALHQLRGRVAAQEQLLAHITQEAADAILGVDPQGTVTSWNRGAEQLMGWSAAEMVGRPLARVALPAKVEELLHRAQRGRTVRGWRMDWQTRDGRRIPVDVSARLLAGTGGPAGIAVVARDLSARLELDRQLMRSEKLAVVGSLAAGLAHEIGTPLNVISATAEYLLLDGRDEGQRRRLEQIVSETDRISRLVRELLSFARDTPRSREPVCVGEAVGRVVSLLRIPMEKKGVRVETDLPAGLPPVSTEPDGLHQILLNLVLNAIQAVPEGGCVAVRACLLDGGEAVPAVRLEIDDSGPGVPEALRERIFDPFFTTRPDGTGLGLAVCARVAASCGGDIRVNEGKMGGACFTVTLPAARGDE